MLCDICSKDEAEIGQLCQSCLAAVMRYLAASNVTKPVITDTDDSKSPGLGGSKHGAPYEAKKSKSAAADSWDGDYINPYNPPSYYGPYYRKGFECPI